MLCLVNSMPVPRIRSISAPGWNSKLLSPRARLDLTAMTFDQKCVSGDRNNVGGFMHSIELCWRPTQYLISSSTSGISLNAQACNQARTQASTSIRASAHVSTQAGSQCKCLLTFKLEEEDLIRRVAVEILEGRLTR